MIEKNGVSFNEVYDQSKNYEAQDLLDFRAAKGAFASTLINVKPPVTVGLYGSWGSGKSWMIEGLCQSLQEANCLTLVLDAWKYRHESNLILPLMFRLSEKYLQNKPDLQKKITRVIGAVGLAAADVGLRIATQGSSSLSDINEALKLAERGETAFDQYSNQIESLELQYKELIQGIIVAHKKEKLVVFVDNLDRCLPDIVVTLLEDISSFLSISGVPCIYILAMDKDNVLDAIHHRFPGFDALRYLEKIVQIPLKMPSPPPEDGKDALYYFMKKYEKAKNIKTESTEGDERDKVYESLKATAREVFHSGYLLNPRSLERIVNKFVTLELLSSFRMGNEPKNVPIALFLLLLSEFHPDVYESLRKSGDFQPIKVMIDSTTHVSTQDFRNDRESKWVNYKPRNFVIANEYCDNPGFSELLLCFQSLSKVSDFENSMKRVLGQIKLIG